MDRSKRTAVVVGVAVVLAAVASLGMYRIVSRLPDSPGRRNEDHRRRRRAASAADLARASRLIT